MREPTGAIAVEDSEAERDAVRASARDTLAREPAKDPAQKCPYLAGRPPHGSYHMWPSGVNVCYARGEGDRPYGHTSKETQRRCCFEGRAEYERCSDYQYAQASGVQLPVFSGSGPSHHRVNPGEAIRSSQRERVKGRRRRSRMRRWIEAEGKSTLVCASWTLLALVAYWLVLRSM